MTVFLAAGDAASAADAFAGSGHYNYWLVIVLMMTGLYVVLSRSNMIKTVIGLNLFQVAVIMFYITMGKVSGGTAPIELKDLTKAQLQVAALQTQIQEGEAPAPEDVQKALQYIQKAAHQLPDGAVSVSLTTVSDEVRALMDGAAPQREQVEESVRKLDYVLTNLVVYSHPLPHVLMLTAIVVGVATIALALALIVRINEAYDTIEEDEILVLEGQP